MTPCITLFAARAGMFVTTAQWKEAVQAQPESCPANCGTTCRKSVAAWAREAFKRAVKPDPPHWVSIDLMQPCLMETAADWVRP
ncbi:MAG: hypothetical protein M3Q51_00270 [Pseudomonadota bacterium]|nr:hypothetical protein [Pseudomonadota bacterium]